MPFDISKYLKGTNFIFNSMGLNNLFTNPIKVSFILTIVILILVFIIMCPKGDDIFLQMFKLSIYTFIVTYITFFCFRSVILYKDDYDMTQNKAFEIAKGSEERDNTIKPNLGGQIYGGDSYYDTNDSGVPPPSNLFDIYGV